MTPFKVNISYFGFKLAFRVFQIAQKNNVEIYELKCGGLNYVVIKENLSWSFMAQLDPCQELKDVIIKRLKKRAINMRLPHNYIAPTDAVLPNV